MKTITIAQFLIGNHIIKATETNVRLLLQINFPNYLKTCPEYSVASTLERWEYMEVSHGMIHYRGYYSEEPCTLIFPLLRKVE